MRFQGYWADLKAPDFRDLPPDTIAILPLGATEQHGPHLPLSVDSTLIDTVLARSLVHWAPETHALILPTLTISKSNEHADHPGTLALSARTLMAVLDDIGASITRAGIRRLFLFNGHGGNRAVLEIACRDLRLDHGLVTAHASWFGFAETKDVIAPEQATHDLHGGDIETSAMLATHPEQVDMGKAVNAPPRSRDWQKDLTWIGLTGQAACPGWAVNDLSPSGICGDATAATVERGEAMLESAARNLAAFLVEFSAFEPRA